MRAGAEHSVMFFSYLSLKLSYHTSFCRIFVFLLVLLVVVVVVVVVVTPAAFFLVSLRLKIVKQVVFSHFFETLGAESTVNIDVLCASEAQSTVFTSFFGPLVAKIMFDSAYCCRIGASG